MKITKVTPYPFFAGPKNLMLCRVDTDEGVYGWGEAYVVQGKEKAVQLYIEAMEAYMIGRSPFEIKHSGTAMFDDFSIRRSSCDFYAAWSAIEIAMWDIAGKVCGQPVYNLLGRPVPREDPPVRQRLVGRRQEHRRDGGTGAGREGQGLHGHEVGSLPGLLAQLHHPRAGGLRRGVREGRA